MGGDDSTPTPADHARVLWGLVVAHLVMWLLVWAGWHDLLPLIIANALVILFLVAATAFNSSA